MNCLRQDHKRDSKCNCGDKSPCLDEQAIQNGDSGNTEGRRVVIKIPSHVNRFNSVNSK